MHQRTLRAPCAHDPILHMRRKWQNAIMFFSLHLEWYSVQGLESISKVCEYFQIQVFLPVAQKNISGPPFLLLPPVQIVSCSILFVTKLKFSSEGRGEGTGLSQQSNSVFLTPSITTWELQHQSNLSFLSDQSIWDAYIGSSVIKKAKFFFRHF